MSSSWRKNTHSQTETQSKGILLHWTVEQASSRLRRSVRLHYMYRTWKCTCIYTLGFVYNELMTVLQVRCMTSTRARKVCEKRFHLRTSLRKKRKRLRSRWTTVSIFTSQQCQQLAIIALECWKLQWLRKYSVAKLKLDLHKMVSGPDCKHVSKPVKSLKKNAEARYAHS